MMIPITRIERYINEIVGNGDTAPDQPITRKEIFYAAIIGEVPTIPTPITNEEKYLSAIANNYTDELPQPVTRIEKFLARAAGMDVETPVPITREEIYWSNYTAIVEFELEGVPPLTYKAIEGILTNYRIYGQTSRNLFDFNSYFQTSYSYSQYFDCNAILLLPNTTYTFSTNFHTGIAGASRETPFIVTDSTTNPSTSIGGFGDDKDVSLTTLNDGVVRLFKRIQGRVGDVPTLSDFQNGKWVMINSGSTALPYEPYGESVGDRTGNLFDGEFLQGYWANANGAFIPANNWVCSSKLPCSPNTTYTAKFSTLSRWYGYAWYDIDGNYISSTMSQEAPTPTSPTIFTATSPSNAAYFGFNIAGAKWNTLIHPEDVADLMIVEGSTPLPYEPYGYKVPVTVSNGTDTLTTPIYLPEQIKKVGDEAEYVDYKEQKQHFADGTSVDVTLPALPTLSGTNTLTVGTEVQPSDVYIKYEGAQ